MPVKHRLSSLQLCQDLRRINHLVGEVRVRINTIPHLRQRAQNHGSIDSLSAKLVAYQNERQQQQERIDTHHDDRERIGIAAYERINDNGETGNRTDDEVAWHEEIIDSYSTKAHTDGHINQFTPELFSAQCVPEIQQQFAPIRFCKILFKIFHVIMILLRPNEPYVLSSGSA